MERLRTAGERIVGNQKIATPAFNGKEFDTDKHRNCKQGFRVPVSVRRKSLICDRSWGIRGSWSDAQTSASICAENYGYR